VVVVRNFADSGGRCLVVVVNNSETAVEVKGLSFSYPEGPEVLRGINFSVARGETAVILGPNGAGKSTLCLCLMGIFSFQGIIKIFGQELTPKTARHLRSRMGLVFQDPNDQLFLPRVKDELAFGPLNQAWPEEKIEQKVKEILSKFGLSGYDHRLISHLSLGEKKKVALAAVVILEPDIILLDEPTASLDYRSRRNFLHHLASLNQTKIIATHDLELAWELGQQIIIIDQGRLIASGPRNKVLLNERLLQNHGLDVPLTARLRAWPKNS